MANEKPLFEWKGNVFPGFKEAIDFALKLKDMDEIEAFVKAFCAVGPYVRQNVGYISGYYDRDTARKILDMFETAHPIFGTGEPPSTDEILEIGKKLGASRR